MENEAYTRLSQSVAEFHRISSESQTLAGSTCAALQSTQTNHAIQAYQCLRGHGMSQGIARLCQSGLGLLLQAGPQGQEALRRMSQGLCVRHRTLIANAKCEYLSLSATRSRLLRQHYCPYGTPKWVKTRLAASLRQGLMVILSAKSSHA